MGWIIALAVFATAFVATYLFGRWLNKNQHRYPLPKEAVPPTPTISMPEGTPVSKTPDGRLWLEIQSGTCPHCHDPDAVFSEGPSGGMSTNIRCTACGWWFNVTPAIGIAQSLGFKDRGVH